MLPQDHLYLLYFLFAPFFSWRRIPINGYSAQEIQTRLTIDAGGKLSIEQLPSNCGMSDFAYAILSSVSVGLFLVFY
jgi:hypothetical protein